MNQINCTISRIIVRPLKEDDDDDDDDDYYSK